MKLKTLVALILGTTGLCLSANTLAQENPWLIRGRVVNVAPENKDSTGLNLEASDKIIPEVDISYFFTPNLAAELILTYPQKHDLESNGTNIGSVKLLPPTLSLQYHFLPQAAVRPYVGVGVNYTLFSSEKLPAGVTIEDSSFGWSLQAGVDIPLNKTMSINIDIKKVQIQTDVSAAGNKLGTLKIDPLLIGVGFGWRF